MRRRGADAGKGINDVSFAQCGASFNDRMGMNSRPFTDLYRPANHTIRPDFNIAVDFGTWIDDRGRVHPAHLTRSPHASSTSIAEISACATTLPSTEATPCIFQ